MKRRRFLATASAGAAITAPAIVRGQNLNSAIQLGGVGASGKGFSDLREMSYHPKVQLVAMADVDLSKIRKALAFNTEAGVFQDFREMLAKHGDGIDACTISTPDHMHAYIALHAMAAGKHVYVQKPLTHNVREARLMRLMAKKQGVITRMGNQIHSHEHYRTGVKLVQDGVIGKIKTVHSWVATTGHGYSGRLDRPSEAAALPPHLDWDAWIGVAAMRPPAAERIYHPFSWRDWQDFGSGAIGDFGCHILDPVFTALEIKEPLRSLHNDHTGINDEVWPCQQTIRYEFPGTPYTAGDSLKITWYDGLRKPNLKREPFSSGKALPRSGSLFMGEEGNLILPHVGAPSLHPEEKYADFEIEPVEGSNHYHDWIEGCLSGKQPSDGFDYAGPLTEAVQLGNVAARFPKERLEWDAEGLRIPNRPEADRYLTRTYREGWELPELE